MSQLALPAMYAESMISYSSQHLPEPIPTDIAKQYYNPFSLLHDSEFTMLYFHKSQKIPSRYQIDSRSHGMTQVWFYESLPMFSCRSGFLEPQIFCFSLFPDKKQWSSHFYGFLEHYASKYLQLKPYPSIVRMSLFKSRGCLCEGLHPYLLLYYKMFLCSSRPYVENLRNYIDSVIDAFNFFGKTDMRKEFAHWCIDTKLIRPDPLEILGLSSFFPSDPLSSSILKNYIYAVRQGKTRFIKIGRTTSPSARLKSLQIGSGVPLKMEYLWQVPDAGDIERKLHERFGQLRMQGEWFHFSLEDEAELLACMAEYQQVTPRAL